MNKREYMRYQKSVEAFFKREGLNNLSSLATEDDDGDMVRNGEPYFSWRHCECCGSHLAGDREECEGYNPTTEEICGPYSVCQDCVYYAEYGRLDDTAMSSVGKEEWRINSAYCMADLTPDTPWQILHDKLVDMGMDDEAEFILSVYGDDEN